MNTNTPALQPRKKKKKENPIRDDFTAKTIRLLRDEASGICSKPDCRIFTNGSKQLLDGPTSIGIAAHITAAAPGGPRYDKDVTKEERRSISNGIWLCQNHARLIDVDVEAYPVRLLREWKVLALKRAAAMVGQKSITEQEMRAEVRKESGLTLASFLGRNENPIQTPVSDILSGYEHGLSKLDPRFEVKAVATSECISHTITAIEPGTKLKIQIKNINEVNNLQQSAKEFFEEGCDFSLHSSNFQILGSPLFDEIGKEMKDAYLTFSSDKHLIRTNLYISSNTGQELLLDTFDSHGTFGSKRLVAHGKALGGYFQLKLTYLFENNTATLEITTDASAWVGRDVMKIPYYARQEKALQWMDYGELIVEFEIGDELPRFTSSNMPNGDAFLSHYYWIIKTIAKCRILAKKLPTPLIIKALRISQEDYDQLTKYCELINGKIITNREPGLISKVDLDDSPEIRKLINTPRDELVPVTVTEMEGTRFEVLGQTIKAPKMSINIAPVYTAFFSPLPAGTPEKMAVYAANDCTDEIILINEDWQFV